MRAWYRVYFLLAAFPVAWLGRFVLACNLYEMGYPAEFCVKAGFGLFCVLLTVLLSLAFLPSRPSTDG